MGDAEIKTDAGHVCLVTHTHTDTSHVYTRPLAVGAHTIVHMNTQMHTQNYTAGTGRMYPRRMHSNSLDACANGQSYGEGCVSCSFHINVTTNHLAEFSNRSHPSSSKFSPFPNNKV